MIVYSPSITGSINLSGSLNLTPLQNAPVSSSAGNIYFDATNNAMVVSGLGTGNGVWSAGGALITARHNLAGTGTQTAALAFGGQTSPSSTSLSCTEKYNGSVWSSTGALSTARYLLAGAGTQNAGLAFGGFV